MQRERLRDAQPRVEHDGAAVVGAPDADGAVPARGEVLLLLGHVDDAAHRIRMPRVLLYRLLRLDVVHPHRRSVERRVAWRGGDFYKILLQSNFQEVHNAIFGEPPSELAKKQIDKSAGHADMKYHKADCFLI